MDGHMYDKDGSAIIGGARHTCISVVENQVGQSSGVLNCLGLEVQDQDQDSDGQDRDQEQDNNP